VAPGGKEQTENIPNLPPGMVLLKGDPLNKMKQPLEVEGMEIISKEDQALYLTDLDKLIFTDNRRSTGQKKKFCRICGKNHNRQKVRNHIEARHIIGPKKHKCILCPSPLKFKTMASLEQHRRKAHGKKL
jgi:hypothetical protein